MATTPDRQTITISRIKSPRTPSSPGTVAALRVEEAVASFIEFHRKWQQAVEKGSQFCNAIRNIKKTVLQTTPNDYPYPENLVHYCKNLLVMVTIMEDVVTNAANIATQLRSLEGSFGANDVIGQTWNFHKTLHVIETAITSYKKEITTRKYVAENIGHTLSADQLSLFVCVWNHLIDIDRDRELRIKMMMNEFKLD